MYSWSQIKKGIKMPRRALNVLLADSGIFAAHDRLLRSVLGRNGLDVMAQDWDNLVVLDGCRYDLFEATASLGGVLEAARSRGSSTKQWMLNTFKGNEFPETVYVSANPQIEEHNLVENFHDCYLTYHDLWDEEMETVTPSSVAQVAREVSDKYPHKRLIIHFIQPHYPFIGDLGQQQNQGGINPIDERKYRTVWRQLATGDVSREWVWRAYRENLEIVLPFAESLVNDLIGKTVIMSDHGNALGEWGVYGHPHNRHIKPLMKVPWMEFDADQRKDIVAEGTPDAAPTEDGDIVTDRLEHLGYVES
jgi:hypothetical protein